MSDWLRRIGLDDQWIQQGRKTNLAGMPVWAAGGRSFTLCARCNTILNAQDGPRCAGCAELRADQRRQSRRQRKRLALRERLGVPA